MNILITGGASGLGAAITRRLAQEAGCAVYFTYNQSEEAAKKLAREFSNVHAVKCDFRSAEEIQSLTEKIPSLDIDVLINNAYSGEAVKTHFHKINTTDFSSDFTNNILPTVQITQAAISHFRKKKKGRIITILTSFLLDVPPIGASVYVANKAYLGSLVRSWAVENAKFNIVSNSVSPAFMLTNFTKDTDERILEQMIESHPLKKILAPEEVADSVAYLMNASPQINGIDLVINSAAHIK